MIPHPWPRAILRHNWQCRVIDVADDTVWAIVYPGPGTPGASVEAAFDSRLFARKLEVSDLFDITMTYTQATLDADVVRTTDIGIVHLGYWTEEEVADIRKRARARWLRIQKLVATPPEPRTSEV